MKAKHDPPGTKNGEKGISVIVLAGGKSTRMGADKAQVLLGEATLLEVVLGRVCALSEEIIIVAGDRTIPQVENRPEYKVVNDCYPGMGSLGGIYTGLRESKAEYGLVVACDMPFLNTDLLAHMTQYAGKYDIVIPRINNLLEPLHAIYSRRCLPSIDFMLKDGNLRIYDFFDMHPTKYIDKEEIENIDPGCLSFYNINTLQELEKACAMLARGSAAGKNMQKM